MSSPKKSKNSEIKISDKSIIEKKSDSITIVNSNGLNDEIQNKKIEKNIYILDYEINNFSFEEALKKDKRTFFQFYISLLKINHILFLFFAFNKKNDYDSFTIKLCLFFFYLTLNLIINSLFFNESTIHQIYIDKGIFNLNYILPKIIYSIIICSILFGFLRKISLIQQNIFQIKHEKKKI